MALTTILTKTQFDNNFITSLPTELLNESSRKRYIVPIPVANRGNKTRFINKNHSGVSAVTVVAGEEEEVLLVTDTACTIANAREITI